MNGGTGMLNEGGMHRKKLVIIRLAAYPTRRSDECMGTISIRQLSARFEKAAISKTHHSRLQ